MKVGDRVETPNGSHHDIIRITEDSGIQLSDCYFYCRSELKLVDNKPTKTELIDKAIDDLGGVFQSKGDYRCVGRYSLNDIKFSLFYKTDDNFICTREEFEQRKKEREMEQTSNNTYWYDYDKERNTVLPPVDTMCEYSLSSGRTWYKCKVISHNNLVLECPHLESVDNNGLQVLRTDVVTFRPLDWDKLSAKRRLIHEVKATLYQYADIYDTCDSVERLYEMGYLKLPESK